MSDDNRDAYYIIYRGGRLAKLPYGDLTIMFTNYKFIVLK